MSDTYTKACAAYINLCAQGIRPTVTKIREEIGGGSTDLIQRAIKDTEAEHLKRVASLASIPDAPSFLSSALVRIWEEANQEADKRFESRQQELQTTLIKFATELKEEKAASAAVKNELEEIRRIANARAIDVETKQSQIHSLEALNTQLQNALEVASAKQELLNSELNKLLESHRVEHAYWLNQLDTERVGFKQLESRLNQNIEAEKNKVSALEERLAKVTGELSATQKMMEIISQQANKVNAKRYGPKQRLDRHSKPRI